MESRSRPSTSPATDSLGFVVGHGFTLNWQRPHVWRVANRLNRHGGVVAFDFRGHGRSGGATTLGDKEIKDVDAAVRTRASWAMSRSSPSASRWVPRSCCGTLA